MIALGNDHGRNRRALRSRKSRVWFSLVSGMEKIAENAVVPPTLEAANSTSDDVLIGDGGSVIADESRTR